MLESTKAIDTIVLDKTGTITTGRMTLADVAAAPGQDIEELLRLAAAVENASEHPVAVAITAGARDRLGDLPAVADFDSHQGLGVTGVVDSRAVAVGRPAWLESQWAMTVPAGLAARAAAAEAAGETAVRGLGRAGPRPAVVADTIKPTSAEAIGRLRGMGLRPVRRPATTSALPRRRRASASRSGRRLLLPGIDTGK